MTQRLHDWQVRFEACLAERWARPFEWGVHDCSLFAADCVRAITGEDPASAFRGLYDSKDGAARQVMRAGGLAAIATAALGQEIEVRMAQAGDVGLTSDEDDQPALAVCGGTHWLIAGPYGLAIAPSAVSRAWRCC